MKRLLSPTRSCMLLLACFFVMPGGAFGEEAAGSLDRAAAKYREAQATEDRDTRLARFASAQRLYWQLTQSDSPSAGLWTNAGNAALQAEDLGNAILAYRRALALDPDHRQASQNIEHARSLLPAWVARPSRGSALDAFFFWHKSFSRAERTTYAALGFALAVLLLAASIRWRRSALRNLALLPALGWAALMISVFIDQGEDAAAVITNEEVVVRSSDSANAASRFSNPLPGGAEVSILQARETWTQIQLADGRDGWVPASSLTRIRD